jgi:acyl carrier protein
MPEIRKDVDVRGQIREFVLSNFYVPAGDVLTDETSLFDGGYVDSTGVLELIAFIEGRFGIAVADAETVPENLDSIARVARFVERKLSR